MSMNIGKTRYHIVDPNSTPANGIISFDSSGSTNITFNIAQEENAFLDGKSVKICFKLVIRDGDTNAETSAGQCRLSMGIGNHGLFGQIDAFSYENNANISSSRSYNRLCSTIIGNGMADQNDMIYSQSHAGVGMSEDYMSSAVGIYSAATPSAADFQSYCIRPLVGSVLGTKYYLGSTVSGGIGGIKLNLLLQPSSNAITNLVAPTNDEYIYELSEVKCLYSTIIGSPQEVSALRLKSDFSAKYSEFVRTNENRQASRDEIEENFNRVSQAQQGNPAVYKYRDFNSFLNTVQSDNHNVSLNIGTKKTSSVFANFVASTDINSTTLDDDGNESRPILDTGGDQVALKSVSFTKGSELYPAKFLQNSNVDENYTDATKQDYTNERNAVTKKYLLDSVVPYYENDYQKGAASNSTNQDQYAIGINDSRVEGVFGIGSGQNSVVNGNADYMFQPLGMNINTQLLGTFDNTSSFIFSHYTGEVNVNNGVVSVSV
jgi:hypothetical protein